MQFEECLTCPSIKERTCTGPKFMRAPTKDILEWLTAYQKIHSITNAQLATASGVPKGTIDGLKNRADVRHETLYPLLKAAIELTGGVWDGETCPIAVSAEQREEILRLKEELAQANGMLSINNRVIKDRTKAIYALFGLCAGLVVLLALVLTLVLLSL